MKKNEVITFENVNFAYDDLLILDAVNLSIYKGEFIGIFGPNGGGKTTFLKLLMGFLKPLSGSIQVLAGSAKGARKQLGYVPQNTRVDKQFPISVLEVVLAGALSLVSAFGFYPKKVKERAEEALIKVGLIDYKDRPFGTLSGGQAQRVLIARSIISEPQILLLDEPTASVDPEAEQEIYDLILELKQSMTILMVTHDLQAVIKSAHRLFCIQRKVCLVKPDELCGHFAMGLYHTPLTKGP